MCKVKMLYTYFAFKVILMEEDLKFNRLYDIYGKLLTKKQQDIFEEYFLYNLSLREIAENKNISYQAVRDSIEKSKKMLENYESSIGMESTLTQVERVINMCKNKKEVKSCDILNILLKKEKDDM